MNYKFSSLREYKKMELQILHKNAFVLFSDKFEDWEDFMNFHNKTQRTVFIDTNDDIKRQELEIALGYLLQMQQELGLDRAEYIIEEKGLRERFKEYLREKMKISIRASDRVWGELKKRYIH